MSKNPAFGLGALPSNDPLALLLTPPSEETLRRLRSDYNNFFDQPEGIIGRGLRRHAGRIHLPQTTHWLNYKFDVYRHDGNWNAVSGLYVFAGTRLDSQGIRRWHAYYIGKTQNFADYLPTHRKWPAAVRLGATHVHTMVIWGEETRKAIEHELIRAYQPPLNIALK